MGTPSAGSVVLVPFPFSDLTGAKLRPAVVLAATVRRDWILCPVTSNPYSDASAVPVLDGDFQRGGWRRASFARPGKLFTASNRLLVSEEGTLRPGKLASVVQAVISILQSSVPSPRGPCR